MPECVQFFRPQDNTTAEYISKRTADVVVDRGIRKVHGRRYHESAGGVNVITAPDWKEKKYLEPWEVREIGTNEFLLFAAGKNGVHRGARRSYLEPRSFRACMRRTRTTPDRRYPEVTPTATGQMDGTRRAAKTLNSLIFRPRATTTRNRRIFIPTAANADKRQ